ncbi:MAG: flagellar basal body P-ring formation chaperone FlgA [Planctomycetota bacterium]
MFAYPSSYCRLLLASLLFAASSAHTRVLAEVVLELKQEATISSSAVRIGDVANLIGGDARDRSSMARLDLESLEQSYHCQISASQIATRLRLAGFSRSEFRIVGANTIDVQHASPLRIRSQLTRKIADDLATQFAIDSKKLSVEIESDAQWSGLQALFSGTDYQVTLPPLTELPSGRTRLNLRLSREGENPVSVPIDLRVSFITSVAVATVPIARGTPIDQSMVRVLERRLDGRKEYANPSLIIGRAAARGIPANSIILANQLSNVAPRDRIVIRRNDLIDVVLPLGAGEVRLKNARAMQSGAIGDTIEVLNPNSNRRLNASVAGPNLATLPNSARKMR